MKKILFIVGSLRKNSFNLRLAKEAAKVLAGKAEVSFLDYSALPFMNQDVEFPAPEAVADIRRRVSEADGLWIFSPEYNHSYPGHLKNLIDWLSRPIIKGDPKRVTAIAGKKVCLSGAAGKSGAADCMDKLEELLTLIRADLMREPRVGVALGADSFINDTFSLTEAQREDLGKEVEAFLHFI